MDDPEGHEVRQSHLSCPAKAGAGCSVRGFGMSRDFDGRCPGCLTLVGARDLTPARSESDLPAHIVVESEASCGCWVEVHAACSDDGDLPIGPPWKRLWSRIWNLRHGFGKNLRILVRCPKHGGDRSVLYRPTSWTEGKSTRLVAREAVAIIFGTFIAVLMGAVLFFVITGRWPT